MEPFWSAPTIKGIFVPGGKSDCSCGRKHGFASFRQPDHASLGPPCQSFAALRHKTGSTPKTSSVESHPDHRTVMVLLPKYFGTRRPKTFVCEESDGMLRRIPNGTMTYAFAFMSSIASAGFRVAMLEKEVTDHSVWSELKKTRCTHSPLRVSTITFEGLVCSVPGKYKNVWSQR